jgi:hypothetical protein
MTSADSSSDPFETAIDLAWMTTWQLVIASLVEIATAEPCKAVGLISLVARTK